jgi:hypothetical protein
MAQGFVTLCQASRNFAPSVNRRRSAHVGPPRRRRGVGGSRSRLEPELVADGDGGGVAVGASRSAPRNSKRETRGSVPDGGERREAGSGIRAVSYMHSHEWRNKAPLAPEAAAILARVREALDAAPGLRSRPTQAGALAMAPRPRTR